MKYFPPFTCVHEKLQFINNDPTPLTCICSSYPRIAVPQQEVSEHPSEVKALSVASSDISIQDKPQTQGNHSFLNSSCENSIECKTKSREKRIDKPLYIPPARRMQKYHTSVHTAKTGAESITKKNSEKVNDKQGKSHLNVSLPKTHTSSVENNKNIKACYLNETRDDTSHGIIPNSCISAIQHHIDIDFKIKEESITSKETCICNDKDDIHDDWQSTLPITSYNVDDCSEPSSQGISEPFTIPKKGAENPIYDSKLHEKTSVSNENSNIPLMKIDLFNFDSSLNAALNNNSSEQWRKKETLSLKTESGCSSNSMHATVTQSLNPDLIKELQAVIGNAEIHSAKYDYTEFKLSEKFCGEFLDIVEIYGFPVELKTQDLVLAFSKFKSEDFTIKWVNDCHAIGIFSSPFLAIQALELEHPLVKVRPLADGLRESKLVAKRYIKQLESSKSRPATSAVLAKRLVTMALGLKTEIPREERERKKK